MATQFPSSDLLERPNPTPIVADGEPQMVLPTNSEQKLPLDHGVTRDLAKYNTAKPSLVDYLRHAQRQSGRKTFDLVREYLRLQRGRGKLSLPEYVQFGVYDTSRNDADAQSRFISNMLHWPITHVCCDMTWQATTEDKWLCSHILEKSGVPTPATLAVIDKTERRYIGTQKITSADQLRAFATSRGAVPFFGKENRGICSFGAFLVEAADSAGLILKGHGRVAYDEVMEKFIGETPYLLQSLQKNHAFLQQFTPNLATVRVCILNGKQGVRIPFAILKLPSASNVADSFWRPGNLACALDVGTGKIVKARSRNPFGVAEHTHHPETGAPLVGEVLPMWDSVIELARVCAPIFHAVRYQSMDIAITPNGPVLIEINTGGGFDLPQLATGEGFLTDEVCEFFRSCGYKKV